jgi:hypothetical protein
MSLAYLRHREGLERLASEFEAQLNANIIKDLRESARAGEYEVGFELLCNMLFEHSVRIPRTAFTEIETLGTDLGMTPGRWTYLEPLIHGEAPNRHSRIVYPNGVTPVQLGDHVRVRLFLFIRKTGRITYLPGISPLHREMEHNGIRNVGITFDDGGAGGFYFDPDTMILSKAVTFLGRDSSLAPQLPAEEDWR